jgi:hypothetical protein
MQAQDFQFGGGVESVAALRFQSCCSVLRKSLERSESARCELSRIGAAQIADGGKYSAAAARNLFVGASGDALFMFVRAARGENEMRVRIHKTGEDHTSAEVQLLSAAREGVASNVAAASHRDNFPIVD